MAGNDLARHGQDSEVLAPTLFWAFLSIALNTMTQPSGRVLGFPSIYNFALRISPTLCAVHAISTAVELFFRTVTQGSVKEAFLSVAAQRLDTDSTSGSNEGAFSTLRRNTIFRIGLFILGALPQALMVYSCRGIPWAQSCCTAYLISFALDEAIIYFGIRHVGSRIYEYTEDLHLERVFGHSATVVRSICGYLGTESLICLCGVGLHFYLFLPVGIGLQLLTIFSAYIVIVLGGSQFTGGFQSAVYPTGIWTCFIMGSAAIPFSSSGWHAYLVGFGTFIGLLLLGTAGGKLEIKWSARSTSRRSGPLATYLLLQHTATIFIYLGNWYDASNTLKPYWTNWLG